MTRRRSASILIAICYFFIIASGTAHCSDAMFMLVTLNPDAAMHHPGHADLVADIGFAVIGTHQLDTIWVFLVLQHLLAIFFGDAAGNCHLFAHGI
jgi:hypothetical protein